jgi:hypothetical protein
LSSTGSPPAAADSYSFTVEVTDSAGNTATQPFTLVIPVCSPVSMIFSDETGAAGVLQTSISSSGQQVFGGQVTADVRVENSPRVWLELGKIQPESSNPLLPVPTLTPDLDAGVEGATAQAGVLPPCQASRNPFTPCRDSGVSAWKAGFCSAGDITMTTDRNALGL